MIKVSKPIINNLEIERMNERMRSGMYISGKYVQEFEKEFSKFIGTEYAVAVNSGTSALHLSLLALGVGEGDEVIVPPMTFFATIEAVLYVGAKPIFVDINDVYTIDPQKIEEKINCKTKAIIPVHLFGMPCNMKHIVEISKKYDIPIIEDCCQSHGASIDSKKTGSFGTANCFSFFATKNMTTTEGGMITTDDEGIYSKCKLLRSHGMTDRNTHSYLGYNYRMTEIEAVIGLEQLKKLPSLNSARKQASLYLLNKLSEIPIFDVWFPPENYNHAYFWCSVFIKEMDVDDFRKYLQNKGIETRHRYYRPLYHQPILKNKYKDLYLPLAEKYAGRIIGLPNHPEITREELDYISDVMGEI
tara:strand:+ start:1925 stop:3001 length:1077 start_codon:yes stop_codon:yes gene_type:complete